MRNANWRHSIDLLLLLCAVGLIFIYQGYPQLADSRVDAELLFKWGLRHHVMICEKQPPA